MTKLVSCPPSHSLDTKTTAIFQEIRTDLGFGMVPNLFQSMAGRPEFLEANWIKFRSTILQGLLPRTLKEMVGVAISQANQSQYALQVHLHSLSALGISEDILSMLQQDPTQCRLPEMQKQAILFGLKAGTTPQTLTTADFALLQDLGMSQEEIYELIATANLFTAVNQYTDAIGLDIDTL